VKPRGPTPSLIGSTNGRPKRVQVINNGYGCSRSHEPFLSGQTCIAIPKLGAAYSTAKRICDECFKGILKKTGDELEELKAL
jgi:hypothetical protein